MVEEKETSRLEAFSDAVFAVAITLLILNIKVPGIDLPPNQKLNDTDLWQALRDEWPINSCLYNELRNDWHYVAQSPQVVYSH